MIRYTLKVRKEGKQLKELVITNDNLCVICGKSIPEGLMVCADCLEDANKAAEAKKKENT